MAGGFGLFIQGIAHKLSNLDTKTLTLLSRVLIRAMKSDDANRYLQDKLQKIIDDDDMGTAPTSRGPTVSSVRRP